MTRETRSTVCARFQDAVVYLHCAIGSGEAFATETFEAIAVSLTSGSVRAGVWLAMIATLTTVSIESFRAAALERGATVWLLAISAFAAIEARITVARVDLVLTVSTIVALGTDALRTRYGVSANTSIVTFFRIACLVAEFAMNTEKSFFATTAVVS